MMNKEKIRVVRIPQPILGEGTLHNILLAFRDENIIQVSAKKRCEYTAMTIIDLLKGFGIEHEDKEDKVEIIRRKNSRTGKDEEFETIIYTLRKVPSIQQ